MKKITLLFALLISSIGFSQTYDLLESFNGTGLEGTFGGTTAAYDADPTSASTQVVKITSTSGTGDVWQGINVVLTSNYTLTSATQLSMQMDVYSTTAITIAPKAQGGVSGAPNAVTSVDHTGSGWETLTFTFDKTLDGQGPANGIYADFALHINWNTAGNTYGTPDGRIFYMKNLKGLAVATTPDPVPPTAAPSPTNSDSNIIKIYNDTGAFTANSISWPQAYDFGTNAGNIDLDPTAAVNNALKMNFAAAGWGAGSANPVDITNYTHVHLDYYVPTLDPGSNGHEFKFIIIGEGQGEKDYVFKESGADAVIAFDQWVSVDIPLTHYEGLGLTKDKFLQYKLGSTSDLNTKLVYFDNIYIYNSATASADNNKLLGFSMYPNPANNTLTISAKETIQNADVYNVLGKKVRSFSVNKSRETLDVSNLSTGIYLVKYTVDGVVGTAKFIKQ
ncbi:MAG: T9SS type A sorting domain-containing protein [Polaribacter sp.]|uniref:T9SS type A sorting domain-containing protein n=1 Tax=Polaribacter sp. TaxID=1920175 RepID=UPI003BAF771A